MIGLDRPAGIALLVITCWRQIYGLLCMVVNGDQAASFDDFVPLFNRMVDISSDCLEWLVHQGNADRAVKEANVTVSETRKQPIRLFKRFLGVDE